MDSIDGCSFSARERYNRHGRGNVAYSQSAGSSEGFDDMSSSCASIVVSNIGRVRRYQIG